MDKELMCYLDAKKTTFKINENGFCMMEYEDEIYKRVNLLRMCPQKSPYKFICVQKMDSTEIGIIKDLDELNEESKNVVIKELERKYFCPEITKFISIKLKPGTAFIDCMFGEVRKSFAVRDVSHNVFYVDEKIARINDSDGNRYIVNIDKLNKKSRKMIEPLLY